MNLNVSKNYKTKWLGRNWAKILLPGVILAQLGSCLRSPSVTTVSPPKCQTISWPSEFPLQFVEACDASAVCLTVESAVRLGLYLSDINTIKADLNSCPGIAWGPQ